MVINASSAGYSITRGDVMSTWEKKQRRKAPSQRRDADTAEQNALIRFNDKARIDRSTRLRERERQKRIQLQQQLQEVRYE